MKKIFAILSAVLVSLNVMAHINPSEEQVEYNGQSLRGLPPVNSYEYSGRRDLLQDIDREDIFTPVRTPVGGFVGPSYSKYDQELLYPEQLTDINAFRADQQTIEMRNAIGPISAFMAVFITLILAYVFRERIIKKESEEHREDNRRNCYLTKSGMIEQDVLDKADEEIYDELFNNELMSQRLKEIAKNFLLPYNISLLKFVLNKEYYENPFPFSFDHNYEHIAPSLKKIKENPIDNLPLGIPDWFIVAFPDVVMWIRHEGGRNLLEEKYKKLSSEDIGDGHYLNDIFLDKTIKLYVNTTKKSFECGKY